MSIRLDPEGHEAAALAACLPAVSGLRVLEVGCGDGRVTQKYARRVASILAIDPDAGALAELRAAMPAALLARITLRQSTVEALELQDAAVDLVLLSWSL